MTALKKNIQISVQYDGTDFFGWQFQPDKRTVQGEIEKSLQDILHQKIRIIGAGRTDQGVHALGQVANFESNPKIELRKIRMGINALTADDVYISAIKEVGYDFHSRFSAKSKIYSFHIIFEPFPYMLRYNWYAKAKLDIQIIKKASDYIIGEHDFAPFSVRNGKENTLCTIFDLSLTRTDTGLIITIEGDRFLRKMVRGIVGFLYDIGRGRFSVQDVEKLFSGKIQDLYFVPPQGLFLQQVKY